MRGEHYRDGAGDSAINEVYERVYYTLCVVVISPVVGLAIVGGVRVAG